MCYEEKTGLSHFWYAYSLFTETLSKFGSGLFLLVQVVILLDATHTWNDAWVEKDERKWCANYFNVSSSFFYLTSIFPSTLGLEISYCNNSWIIAGTSLYLQYQLDAILPHLQFRDLCSFGSTPQAMTAALMSSSLS